MLIQSGTVTPLGGERNTPQPGMYPKWVVCAEQVQLQEVAVCFGGQLMRGNRAQKVNASNYQAFDSPTYHKLALLGVEVDWQARYLLQVWLANMASLVKHHIW